MKLICLIEIGRSFMEMLSKNGIKINDYKYISMWYDYNQLRNKQHEKFDYTIEELSRKYKISKSTIIRLLHKFNSEL